MRLAGSKVKNVLNRGEDSSSSDEEFFDQAGAPRSPRKMEGNQAGLGFDSESVSHNELRAQVCQTL